MSQATHFFSEMLLSSCNSFLCKVQFELTLKIKIFSILFFLTYDRVHEKILIVFYVIK